MPNTSEALIIALLFIGPGLLYELGIEREIGYWRTGLADRTLRFFATSTIIHALAAPATFWVWRSYLAEPHGLSAYSLLPLPLWAAIVAYLVLPLLVGVAVGRGARGQRPWLRPIIGRDPTPKAWDHVFGQPVRRGYIRLKLSDGTWVGGLWISPGDDQPGAYASSFPQPEDLYLPVQFDVDPRTGGILLDAEGKLRLREWGLLVERSKIEFIEFQDV